MRIISLVFLQILFVVNGLRNSNFIPQVQNYNGTFIQTLTLKPLEVNAFSERQQLVIIEEIAPFKINCMVSELSEEFAIKEAYLCRKEEMSSTETCLDVSQKTKVPFQSSLFNIYFKETNGFVASLSIPEISDDDDVNSLYGLFYCKLENSIDKIVSNIVEIHNLPYYSKVMKESFEPLNGKRSGYVKSGDILDCGLSKPMLDIKIPSWLRPLLPRQFIWLVQTPGTKDKMVAINTVYEENEHFQIFLNNSIRLFSNIFTKENTNTFKCIDYDGIYYSSHVVSLDNKHNTVFKNEPQVFDVVLRTGDIFKLPYNISIAYQSSGTTYTWEKDNLPLNKKINQTKNALFFPKIIDSSYSGIYTIKIYEADSLVPIVHKFNVKVLDVPRITPGFEVAPVSYIMSKQSLSLKTKFEGDALKTNIEINNIKISTESKNEINRDLILFKKEYPYLSPMKVLISKKEDNHTTQYAYNARNINGLWFKTGHSHRITFNAENEIGSLKDTTVVKVVEFPRWKVFLDKYNCTEECYSNQPHFFKCAVYDQEYIDVGLKVDFKWRINDADVNNFSDEIRKIYFEIDSGSFLIKKISTKDAAQDLRIVDVFRNATLSCSVALLANKKLMNGSVVYQEIYDSSNSRFSTSTFSSKTQIYMIAINPIRDGSLFMILMICIPAIVVTMVITILICVCYIGRNGKSYDIDQEERNAGKDPEKEMFDELYFKQYHREEESCSPITHDTISWSHHSNKSYTGEIDLYESGNENYDEGSIIGQYGVIKSKPTTR